MRRALLPALLISMTACAGSSERQPPPSNAPERLRCDALAAEAIQVADPARARDLARSAADCYAALPARAVVR